MWPFRKQRPAQVEVALPEELAVIGDETPLRSSITIAHAGELLCGS